MIGWFGELGVSLQWSPFRIEGETRMRSTGIVRRGGSFNGAPSE